MAPRKEKTEKIIGDAAADTIKKYLAKQNRPYSATDISANLHNKVTKTLAAKILKELHEKKEIEGKAAGKQIVYHSIQDPSAVPTPEELAAVTTKTDALRAETAAALTELKKLKTQLAALNSSLSTADLRASIAALESEGKEIEARLGPLRSGSVKPVSEQEKDDVRRALKKWGGVAEKRRKIAREMWGMIEEGVGMGESIDVKELKEQLGLNE